MEFTWHLQVKKAKNEIFNIGDINLKEFELIIRLKELSGWKGELIIDDDIDEPYNYAQNIQMENSKIKHVLNYEALIKDESAFLKTIQNYREQEQ